MYLLADRAPRVHAGIAVAGALAVLAACSSRPPPREPANIVVAPPAPTPSEDEAEPNTGGSETKLVIGQPTTTNSFAPDVVRRALQQEAMQLTYCYDKWLLISNSNARGQLVGGVPAPEHSSVEARFTIGADGSVAGASATGIAKIVESCLAEALEHLQLEKTPTGSVDVVVTLRYTPTATWTSSPAAAPGQPQ